MKIKNQIKEYSDVDCLVIFSYEEEKQSLENLAWIKNYCSELLQSLLWNEFSGKKEQVLVSFASGDGFYKKIILAGLGKREKFNPDDWYSICSKVINAAKQLESKNIALPYPVLQILFENSHWHLREFLFSAWSVLYEFKEYKTQNKDNSKPSIDELITLLDEPPSGAVIDTFSYIEGIIEGLTHARNLITSPSNEVTPQKFAEEARKIAEENNLNFSLITLDEARQLGMGAFSAVAQGSSNGGCIAILEYCPKGCENENPIVFVGKGITFDTGGISLKPSKNMDLMKHDMAGAAAVLGTMEIVGKVKPPRRVVGIMPCAENMPDGKAYRPGDVVKSFSGKTIEVVNTDAEGRLILCDALAYAVKHYSPAIIVDIATLTGACIIALGDRVAGIMGNDMNVVNKIKQIAEDVGEKMWPLPLWDFYLEDLKSDIADIKNVGNRSAGTIIGGMFLKQFVSDDIPWIHIDIAGPAWAEKPWFHMPKGATGFGIRTFLEIIKCWEFK